MGEALKYMVLYLQSDMAQSESESDSHVRIHSLFFRPKDFSTQAHYCRPLLLFPSYRYKDVTYAMDSKKLFPSSQASHHTRNMDVSDDTLTSHISTVLPSRPLIQALEVNTCSGDSMQLDLLHTIYRMAK